MRYFYGIFGDIEDPSQVFTHKCKTYAEMEDMVPFQKNISAIVEK